MNIREISDIFKDTADNITAIKSYNFGWASDRVRQGNTEDYQELNEFPRVFFSVPTITGSDQTRKQDTYQVTLFFDDLLGYDNEGDEDPTLQIDKWANLQQYANYFVQRLNKIKQSILPNYLFIPEAPSITFDSFTGIQRMITVQLSFNLVVPTNCDPGIITLVQCIANIVTSSNLTASLTTVLKFAASLEGRATVTADINFVQKVASSLNANASLVSDINFVQKVQASLLTSANVTGNIIIPKLVQASLTGAGTTAADLTVNAPSAGLLLDTYPNAAVAYSLRKLRSAYTGSAIRVRRSSDNTEQDIGFTGNDLNTSALTTFCGAGNGFVTTWYDQSGNAQNATMSTQANQPQIVSSGVVVTQNGKPALQYDGTNDGLNATVTGINNTTALCLFYVYSSNLDAAENTGSSVLFANGDFGITHIRAHTSSTGVLSGEFTVLDVRKTIMGLERIGSTLYRRNSNTMVVENTFFLTNGTSFQQNNNNITFDLLSGATLSENLTPNSYNTSTKLNVGYFDAGVFANQKISEFIVYLSNQTTNRSNINANINTNYAIY